MSGLVVGGDGRRVEKRTWHYVFPPLPECRDAFDAATGMTRPWPAVLDPPTAPDEPEIF